jgi:hypothetical protein
VVLASVGTAARRRRVHGASAVDLVLQLKEAPAGAELAEQVGQQLVMAVAIAVLRAPAAIGDLAVIRCWRWRGAGGGRPAAGVCPGVVLASVGAITCPKPTDAHSVNFHNKFATAPSNKFYDSITGERDARTSNGWRNFIFKKTSSWAQTLLFDPGHF